MHLRACEHACSCVCTYVCICTAYGIEHNKVFKESLPLSGKPPATATCTILVHLGDINDNIPSLVEKELVLCGNKVIVPVEDKDKPPFGCPCSFSLGVDNGDKTLKSHWKLDPANGQQNHTHP